MAFRIHRGLWQFQKADGNYETKYKINDSGVIVQTDASGNEVAGLTASSVAWSSITGIPSTFAPSAHNHDGTYLPISGIPAGSDQYLNARVIRNSSAGSSVGLYLGYANQGGGNTLIYGGGSTTNTIDVGNGLATVRGTLYSGALRGTDNVGGTGQATYHPAGIYSTGNNWLYGSMYLNNNSMYDINQIYANIIYDRGNTNYYLDPAGTSNLYTLNIQGNNVIDLAVGIHSGSDFVDGTLVKTRINASGTNGSSFIMEVTGKSYSGGNPPFDLILQGYIYNNTFIATSAISNGQQFPGPIKILEFNGELCFWWPRWGYWNSFNVKVRDANGSNWNQAYYIGNSTEPDSAKKVSVTPYQSWTTHNFTDNSSNWNTAYGWGNHASAGYATTSYVTTQINNLINGAPGALNTLDELAAALGDDANFATNVTNSIAAKLPLSGGTMSGNLVLKSISGTDQLVENTYGAYLHLGSWGVGRTASDAVLVNTAYRADYATSLWDMNISRFTNDSGYLTSVPAQSWASITGKPTNLSSFTNDLGNYGSWITASHLNDYSNGAYRVIADYGGNTTWYIRSNGQFIFGSGHDWTASFRLNLDNGSGYGASTQWAYFGQQDSNQGKGTWRGIRIRKYDGGNVDGDLSAGAYYIGDTRKDTNWDTAYSWGNHAGLYAAASHTHAYVPTNGSTWSPHPSSVREASWNSLYTNYGYISFGPANSSWAHIYSDKNFYFNQDIYVNNAKLATESYVTTRGYITSNNATGANGNFYIDDNYGYGIVGVYSATRYQGIWAMGDSYKLPGDGTTPGSLYGLAWTYNPDYGGAGNNAQAKPGLNHQLLLMMNGRTYTALGAGIWTDGTITTTSHGTSANWNTAYGWGNHASAGYLTSVPAQTWDSITGKPASWLNGGAMVQDMQPSATAFPSGFYQDYNGSGNPTGTWFNYINVRHSNTGNGHGFQLGMSYYDTNLWFRSYQGSTSPTFSAWNYAIHSGNIGSQSVNYATTAGSANAVAWGNVSGKPGTFTPSAHTHELTDINTLVEVIAEIDGLISGKAPSSHTHDDRYYTESESDARYMRADTDATTAGAIRINGSYSYGTYTSASNYKTGADNIVLKGNASGVSGIFFESEKDGANINHPSDFGFIQYSAYGTGTSGESNELIIGVSNDADDHLILNAPNVNGLKFRTGASTTDYTVWHSGNLSLASLGYTGASNANYITNNNQLTNGAGYITGLSWDGVTGKPTTFSPSAHTHAISDVTGLQGALDGKQAAGSYAAASHTHAISDVTGLQGALDGKQAAGSYAASSHTHTPSQVGLGNVSNAAQVTTSYNTSLNSDSRNSRGVTRLYRRDSDSDYSVQTYWTGARWRLYGYVGDSNHADTHVGYADSAGSASSASSATTASNVDNGYVYTTGNNLYIKNAGVNNYRVHHTGSVGVFDVTSQFSIREMSSIWSATRYEWGNWMSYAWFDVDPWGDNWGIGSRPTSWKTVNRGSFLTFGFEDWSDRRHKSAIVEIDNAVDKVKSISGYTYWKRGSEVREGGVIAQDVLAVFPEATGGTEDGYSVKPAALIGLLMKAVKEQQAMIDELTARIESLENK